MGSEELQAWADRRAEGPSEEAKRATGSLALVKEVEYMSDEHFRDVFGDDMPRD
jgi:hypothetical protein